MPFEEYIRLRKDGYVISTDAHRLDLDLIHGFLREAYWCRGIPREVVERSIEHSLSFGLYSPTGAQVGLARVVTDFAVFAYLSDVFVLPPHRGRKLGVWLVESVMMHPGLQSLRRFALATADAHALYSRFGFGSPSEPKVHMMIERSAEQLWGGT